MTMPDRADWAFEPNVKVVEVGHLNTKISYNKGVGGGATDRVETKVPNYSLTPTPCWACKGAGKFLVLTCRACAGRGHSPSMTPVLEHLSKVALAAYVRGYHENSGDQPVVITTEFTEVPFVFPEPESYSLCKECCCTPCECTDEK